MAQFDVNINATLEVDDAQWADLLDAYDGDEFEALQELEDDLSGSNLDSIYGDAWVCSAEVTTM